MAVSSLRPETDWMVAWIWGDVNRTRDGGKTVTVADDGIDKASAGFVAPVRKCPHNDDIFLTGTNRVWRTENFFHSAKPIWQANSPASAFPNRQGSAGTILSIAIAQADRTCSTYAYGNQAGEIRLTRDGGKTWADLDPFQALPGRPVNSLAFDPANSSILYAAFSSLDEATPGKPGHVFQTTSAFAPQPAWVNISPPQNQPFNVVAVDPLNPRLLYAGSDIGLWRSGNAGVSWLRVGPEAGMPIAPVYDIQINPPTGRTVVFTYGRGVFSLGPGITSLSSTGNPPSGSLRIQGTNLAGSTRSWTEADLAPGETIPGNVAGVQVLVNGQPAGVRLVPLR